MRSKPQLENPGRPADLPDFRHPPLEEVVIGLQFAELRRYRTVHAGLLWQSAFRDSFPKFKERSPLDPVFETFGGEPRGQGRVSIQMASGPTVPRIWFLNENGTELVQFQSDRMLHNWRKVGGEGEYPRYENIRKKFSLELSKIREFLAQENLGDIEPNQVEVTYVNHITLPDGEDPRTNLDRILKIFNGNMRSGVAFSNIRSEPEEALLIQRNTLLDPESGEPWGRLHVQAGPAVRADGKHTLRLDLTARGEPKTASIRGAMERLDAGREALVHQFALITTDEMHDFWERCE